MITEAQIRTIMPLSTGYALLYVEPLNRAMAQFNINTNVRQAAFLAQVAHESGQLHYVREIASGAAYEGRKDLGNNEVGDGRRYRGRGLIQVTGKDNYRECGRDLGVNLVVNPELLEKPELAALSAAWYWKKHGCNELADTGSFGLITRKINGGTNGWKLREEFYRIAKWVLEVRPEDFKKEQA
jgi:putative chitinase